MSEEVLSRGYLGKLLVPCADSGSPVWEIFSEKLDEHDLYLSYDGTIIFSDKRCETHEAPGLMFADPIGAAVFREKCKALGYDVDPVKHYTSIWYNGADSPMSTAKVDEVFQ